jgi:hypothetical protein
VNHALWLVGALGIIAVTLAAAHPKPPHPDLAFYLYAARRMLGGAVLYRDIVEINPPLIIWLNIPAVLIAEVGGISEILAYRLLVSVLISGVLLFGYHAAGGLRPATLFRRAPYLLLLPWFILFPLAGDDFGQREHLLLALLVPYILVSAARQHHVQLSRPWAYGAGVLAGLGLALKPHFAVAWAAIEAARRTGSPADRWRTTPELVGTLVIVTAYLAAVAVLTPDYFDVVRILGPAYTQFMSRPLLDVAVLTPAAPRVFFALLAFAALGRTSLRTSAWVVLVAGTVGAYAAAVLQHKGFSYHYYPALALALTLLAAIAASTYHGNWVQRLYGRLARTVVVTTVLVAAGTALVDAFGGSADEVHERAQLASSVRRRAGGRPVGVLSYTINSAFPLMNDAGTVLASRFPCLWPFATSYWDSLAAGGALRYRPPAEMSSAERLMWDAVRADLTTARPRLLLLLRPGRDVPHNGLRRLNYVAYFGRNPDLAALLGDYQLVERQGEYLLYERVESGTPRVGPPPSSETGSLEAPRPRAPSIGLTQLDGGTRASIAVFGVVWIGLVVMERRRGNVLPVSGQASQGQLRAPTPPC